MVCSFLFNALLCSLSWFLPNASFHGSLMILNGLFICSVVSSFFSVLCSFFICFCSLFIFPSCIAQFSITVCSVPFSGLLIFGSSRFFYIVWSIILIFFLMVCLFSKFAPVFPSFIPLKFKYDLEKSITHPKFDQSGIRTHDLKIMDSIFHGPETLA